jgi:DNA-binding transcriptional LysR family regulator
VVGAEHQSCTDERVELTQLTDLAWVLREPGSGTRSAFEAAITASGIPLQEIKVVLELPTNEAVRAAVEAGMGATAISASVAASGLEAGLLQQIKVTLPERAFHVVRHAERYRTAAADALLQLIAGR